MKYLLISLVVLLFGAAGCSDDARTRHDDDALPDDNNDGIPNGSAIGNQNPDNTDSCDTLLEMTVRDFDTTHPDFERADPGWGPLQGVVASTLGTDKKPVFQNVNGTHQISQDEAQKQAYTFTINNWTNTENPMFSTAESFNQWYQDDTHRYEKTLQLKPLDSEPGTYYFDSLEEPYSNFFALSPSEGYGVTPQNTGTNPNNQNFLFTTEIHLRFEYVQGQVFKFSGDDDLWIFVNGKLALDLGGLHSRFNGSINFDTQAAALGITPGETYDMDIFHAERHTMESNFRIETNISCFKPGIVV